MTTSKHLFRRNRNVSFNEKIIFYFFSILIVFFLSECNSSETVDKKDLNDTTAKPASNPIALDDDTSVNGQQPLSIIGEQLNILYADVNHILRLIRLTSGNEDGKIVFQYFVNSSGGLTLSAFSGDKHNINFDINQVLVLKNSRLSVANIPSRLFLGDQEISITQDGGVHNELREIRQEIRRHPAQPPPAGRFIGFITFFPELVPSATNITGAFTIKYHIGYAATEAEINDSSNLNLTKKIIPIGNLSLNPAPPRNGQ